MTGLNSDNLLENYRQNVIVLRKQLKELNLSESEINKLFNECFEALKNEQNEHRNTSLLNRLYRACLFIMKLIFIVIVLFIVTFILLNYHQPTLSLVLRNVQEFIYPGLKLLRLLAIPIIQIFPNLSELYDETCLIENPYFRVNNMDCWPCENVHSVINLTESKNFTLYQAGIPYIIKTLNKSVTLQDIQQLYVNNSDIFDQDAQRLKSSNSKYTKIRDLLNFGSINSDIHVTWRINKMTPARLIRKLFPKPFIVSEWSGQSTERFILVDEINAGPYILPNPECSSVLLTQGTGERTIILKPSQECENDCRTTSVTMKPMFTLAYNWWYWRPISLPTLNTSDISISYVSSYC